MLCCVFTRKSYQEHLAVTKYSTYIFMPLVYRGFETFFRFIVYFKLTNQKNTCTDLNLH